MNILEATISSRLDFTIRKLTIKSFDLLPWLSFYKSL